MKGSSIHLKELPDGIISKALVFSSTFTQTISECGHMHLSTSHFQGRSICYLLDRRRSFNRKKAQYYYYDSWWVELKSCRIWQDWGEFSNSVTLTQFFRYWAGRRALSFWAIVFLTRVQPFCKDWRHGTLSEQIARNPITTRASYNYFQIFLNKKKASWLTPRQACNRICISPTVNDCKKNYFAELNNHVDMASKHDPHFPLKHL